MSDLLLSLLIACTIRTERQAASTMMLVKLTCVLCTSIARSAAKRCTSKCNTSALRLLVRLLLVPCVTPGLLSTASKAPGVVEQAGSDTAGCCSCKAKRSRASA